MYVFCSTWEHDFSCARGAGMTADDTFNPNFSQIISNLSFLIPK
jgi:hypothetical protein